MSRSIQTSPAPWCPDCGARMWLREPRGDQDWDPFWGCARYPHCYGTRQIEEDGTPESDDDLGDLDDYRLPEGG